MITRDLGDTIRRNNEVWASMDDTTRAATQLLWAADGWTTCSHPGCPPWDCRTNGR